MPRGPEEAASYGSGTLFFVHCLLFFVFCFLFVVCCLMERWNQVASSKPHRVVQLSSSLCITFALLRSIMPVKQK